MMFLGIFQHNLSKVVGGYTTSWLIFYAVVWLPIYVAITWLCVVAKRINGKFLARWLYGFLANCLRGYMATC